MITKSSFITNKEYLFPEDSIIITKTNLKGKITFVSPDFISISGYSEEELIGKPHNLIRHPDMPKAAFKDLWDTIEKGLPWNGYVKNRRKNGDYYWVEATVTPIRENGKINGYMSVRKKPSRERIKEAEVLYDKLNRGVSTFSFTKYLKQLNFIKVLFFLIGFLSVIQSMNTILLYNSLSQLNSISSPIAEKINISLFFSISTLFLFLSFGYITIRKFKVIEKDTQNMESQITSLALGSFSYQTLENNKFSKNFRQTRNSLKNAIISLWGNFILIKEQFGLAASYSQKIKTGNEFITHLLQESAAAKEEESAALEEIFTSIEKTSEIVEVFSGKVEQVNHFLTNLLDFMQSQQLKIQNLENFASLARIKLEETNSKVEHTVSSMQNITNFSSRIQDIIGMITDIADKTNLLALNASIEAARAGEHGRGFAIVAREISKLSEQTTGSVGEIKTLISGSNKAAQAGSDSVETITKSLEEIHFHIDDINRFSREIFKLTSDELIRAKSLEDGMANIHQNSKSILLTISEQKHSLSAISTNSEKLAHEISELVNTATEFETISKDLAKNSHYINALVDHFEFR
ncbi:MAG: PAS domain-containing protein [Leptospiraceae bacterium]|nr:PAS domain-containing protein [Leptospiraceae bacterium]